MAKNKTEDSDKFSEDKDSLYSKKTTKEKKSKQPKTSVHIVRLILGVAVGYLTPCVALLIGVFALAFHQGVLATTRWLDIVIIVFLLLTAVLTQFYLYGWLHRCMLALKAHHSIWVRILGNIVGGIGCVFQPLVLIAYGPNKKWLYFLLVGVPSLLAGGLFMLNYFNVIPFDAVINFDAVKVGLHDCSLYIAIAFLLNGLLALCTRRCKHCGCMMTVIEHSIDKVEWKGYDRYDGLDVNGDNVKVGKYYICDNCGYVQKGIGFEVQTDGVVV